jgi:alpha-glucosidase
MNEPSVFNGPGGTMPLDAVHRVRGKPMPHAYCHNTYGMHMIRATREGIAGLRPDERIFVLTRASYAGGQKYAAGWTGDNRSLWEHLEQSVPMTVNWGIAGLAFAGPDVGGFSGSPSPELLTRWIQMGALLPLFRNHTSKGTRDQEPWVHGEPYESANRRAIELRYRLLPYLYSVFREAAVTGVPVARLPLLEFPTWEAPLKAYYIHQFMVGADLFVAPVVRIGETSWGVELPAGLWYDFGTGAPRVSKQKRFKVDVTLESLPMWVRAGAVIPMQSVIQHTGEKPAGPLVLKAYPGDEKRVFPFYEDDGISYAYTEGEYRLTGLSCVREKGAVVFRVESVEGLLGTRVGACRLEVFGVKRKPARVTVGGKSVETWVHDAAAGRVLLELTGLPAGLEVRIETPEQA